MRIQKSIAIPLVVVCSLAPGLLSVAATLMVRGAQLAVHFPVARQSQPISVGQSARESGPALGPAAPPEVSRAVVRRWAAHFGIDPAFALCIVERESDFDAWAVGDEGEALGLWQFHKGTWDWFRSKMDRPIADLRTDVTESTRTAMWAVAHGYGRHWSAVKQGLCAPPP